MRFLSRVIMLVAALALGLGLASPAGAAPGKTVKTVKLVATSLSGKRIYLQHTVSYCVKKTNCEASSKNGSHKVAKYTQTVKVRRDHGAWFHTVSLKPHRMRVYVNGRLVHNRKAKWHAQNNGGFYIAEHLYFNR